MSEREKEGHASPLATALSVAWPCKIPSENVFVQIEKRIFPNCRAYLFKLGPEPAFGRLGVGGLSGGYSSHGYSSHGYTSHASLSAYGAQLRGLASH